MAKDRSVAKEGETKIDLVAMDRKDDGSDIVSESPATINTMTNAKSTRRKTGRKKKGQNSALKDKLKSRDPSVLNTIDGVSHVEGHASSAKTKPDKVATPEPTAKIAEALKFPVEEEKEEPIDAAFESPVETAVEEPQPVTEPIDATPENLAEPVLIEMMTDKDLITEPDGTSTGGKAAARQKIEGTDLNTAVAEEESSIQVFEARIKTLMMSDGNKHQERLESIAEDLTKTEESDALGKTMLDSFGKDFSFDNFSAYTKSIVNNAVLEAAKQIDSDSDKVDKGKIVADFFEVVNRIKSQIENLLSAPALEEKGELAQKSVKTALNNMFSKNAIIQAVTKSGKISENVKKIFKPIDPKQSIGEGSAGNPATANPASGERDTEDEEDIEGKDENRELGGDGLRDADLADKKVNTAIANLAGGEKDEEDVEGKDENRELGGDGLRDVENVEELDRELPKVQEGGGPTAENRRLVQELDAEDEEQAQEFDAEDEEEQAEEKGTDNTNQNTAFFRRMLFISAAALLIVASCVVFAVMQFMSKQSVSPDAVNLVSTEISLAEEVDAVGSAVFR